MDHGRVVQEIEKRYLSLQKTLSCSIGQRLRFQMKLPQTRGTLSRLKYRVYVIIAGDRFNLALLS